MTAAERCASLTMLYRSSTTPFYTLTGASPSARILGRARCVDLQFGEDREGSAYDTCPLARLRPGLTDCLADSTMTVHQTYPRRDKH